VTESLDDALDVAIDALRRGEPVSDALAGHPKHAEALEPLLQTAAGLSTAMAASEMPAGLADNFSIVRAAVQRAQMAQAPETSAAERPAWWQRRLRFASLSLPAGVIAALALAGAAAAAAGAVGEVTGLPSGVERAITLGLAGGGSERPSGLTHPTGTPTSGAASTSKTQTPGDLNRPTTTVMSGTIGHVNGNTFTLTSASGEWKVDTDGQTVIDGTIAEGALATISGDVTAQRNLHAARVEVTALSQATATGHRTTGPQTGHTPGPQNDRTPGSSNDQTPVSTSDHTPNSPTGRP
jgi:uncharacterized protein YdeI (BOF family)